MSCCLWGCWHRQECLCQSVPHSVPQDSALLQVPRANVAWHRHSCLCPAAQPRLWFSWEFSATPSSVRINGTASRTRSSARVACGQKGDHPLYSRKTMAGTACAHVVIGPVVGELVPCFLAGHALLNPFLAASVLLPRLPGTIQRSRRIGHFLHPFVAHLGEPEFDGLGLWAGNALDEAQQGLRGCDVGEVAFAVGGRQFQSVTICHRLAFSRVLFHPHKPLQFSANPHDRICGEQATT